MLNLKIKILSVDESNDFRTIRLSALEKSPEMFGSTYIAEIEKPLDFFKDCLSNSTVFGAYQKNKIIGLATLTQENGIKFSHKASLSSVFIEPEFQKNSEKHVEQILLTVADDNKPAIHLYKKFGFETYGIETQAMKDNGQYTNEVLMKRFMS